MSDHDLPAALPTGRPNTLDESRAMRVAVRSRLVAKLSGTGAITVCSG